MVRLDQDHGPSLSGTSVLSCLSDSGPRPETFLTPSPPVIKLLPGFFAPDVYLIFCIRPEDRGGSGRDLCLILCIRPKERGEGNTKNTVYSSAL